MRYSIRNAYIVSGGRAFEGSVEVDGERVSRIFEGSGPQEARWGDIDARGCCLLPGVIDSHVHFREPGMTWKADIRSESKAAAAGGVTTYFDMPNTSPATTTLEALADKFARASEESVVNYSFFFGATGGNSSLLELLPRVRIPGIKLFMGSSTGDMLVEGELALDAVFGAATDLPIVAHCEDDAIISRNMARAKSLYGDDPEVIHHMEIRSAEACLSSTRRAVEESRRHVRRLHVAHVSTAAELSLIDGHMVTGEAVVGHLLFCADDYEAKGSLIKVNPSIKTRADRDALRKAIGEGRLQTVATDHAPHTLEEKRGGAAKAASGMPMVEHSLVAMLGLVDEGVISMERLTELMSVKPAEIFSVADRGDIREGYYADMVIVGRKPWTVSRGGVRSKCGWSPLEGRRMGWRVERTISNGRTVYDGATVDAGARGREVEFRRGQA